MLEENHDDDKQEQQQQKVQRKVKQKVQHQQQHVGHQVKKRVYTTTTRGGQQGPTPRAGQSRKEKGSAEAREQAVSQEKHE